MSLTISNQQKYGTFSYEVHNGVELIEAGNGYPSQQSAEQSARVCYNMLHRQNFKWNHAFMQNDYMSLEDIMLELELA